MSRWLDRIWTATAVLLGTGFGLGMAPVAPGTFGSLLGPPLAWGLQTAGLVPWTWPYWAVAVPLMALGGPICGKAAKHFHAKDPGCVVYDEIVAFLLVFAAVPVTWTTAIAGFLLFRLFDITKPWPARALEHLPGGWGILMDDLAAGVYAGIVLWGATRIL